MFYSGEPDRYEAIKFSNDRVLKIKRRVLRRRVDMEILERKEVNFEDISLNELGR